MLILKTKQQNKKIDTNHKISTFFSIIVSTRIRNYLHPFKINSSDILFYPTSTVVLSKLIFWWEIAFLSFTKTPHIV